MLARARAYQPSLTPLLMTREVFDTAPSTKAVTEKVRAAAMPPAALTPTEQVLFHYLSQQEKGRLEQEHGFMFT